MGSFAHPGSPRRPGLWLLGPVRRDIQPCDRSSPLSHMQKRAVSLPWGRAVRIVRLPPPDHTVQPCRSCREASATQPACAFALWMSERNCLSRTSSGGKNLPLTSPHLRGATLSSAPLYPTSMCSRVYSNRAREVPRAYYLRVGR